MPDDQTALPPIIARQRSLSIKNLTARMPERGKIKAGGKGAERQKQGGSGTYQMPVKYDHFVVTTLQRGQDGNFIKDTALHEKLGEKPTDIKVRLIYDDIALNFPTRYACFNGRTLWCSGDGESAQRLKADKKTYETVNCTCPRQDPVYAGNDKCKMNGNLSVLIHGAGGVGGIWSFRTTSYNSVIGLLSSMAFIRGVTGGVLANIPLTLTLRPKQATDPQGNQQTIYVAGLEFDGDIDDLQQIGHEIALHRATTHLSIEHIQDEARRVLMLAPPTNAVLLGDDPDDVVEEFYPEEIANAPARPTRAQFEAPTTPAPDSPVTETTDGGEEDSGFDAILFEAGYLSQLEKAANAEECTRLIQASLDDLNRLPPEIREKLIREANGKSDAFDRAKAAGAKYLTVDSDGVVLVEHSRAKTWCEEVAQVLGAMPPADRARYWAANAPTFERMKADAAATQGKHRATVMQFVADWEVAITGLLAPRHPDLASEFPDNAAGHKACAEAMMESLGGAATEDALDELLNVPDRVDRLNWLGHQSPAHHKVVLDFIARHRALLAGK
jgi:hypothetical protein